MQEMRDKKAIRHIETKQQNDISLSLVVIIVNVKGLTPVKRKIGRLDRKT